MKTQSTTLVFQYWDRLRGERSAPERGEIEPGAVAAALPDTFILENRVSDAGPKLIIRLAGTRMCALFGRELKETPFAELWRDAALKMELQRTADAVMDECAGAIAGLTAATATGRTTDFELLLLPLRHGGKTHSRILGAFGPLEPANSTGADAIVDASMRSMRIIWPSGLPRSGPTRLASRSRFAVISGGRSL
jgi:hypothetical protein